MQFIRFFVWQLAKIIFLMFVFQVNDFMLLILVNYSNPALINEFQLLFQLFTLKKYIYRDCNQKVST